MLDNIDNIVASDWVLGIRVYVDHSNAKHEAIEGPPCRVRGLKSNLVTLFLATQNNAPHTANTSSFGSIVRRTKFSNTVIARRLSTWCLDMVDLFCGAELLGRSVPSAWCQGRRSWRLVLALDPDFRVIGANLR